MEWLVNFFKGLVSSVLNWFAQVLSTILEWLVSFYLWGMVKAEIYLFQAYIAIMDQVLEVVEELPRPAIFDHIDQSFCSNWAMLGSFAAGVNLSGPIALVVSAAVARWVMRRIPFIGR